MAVGSSFMLTCHNKLGRKNSGNLRDSNPAFSIKEIREV